jgi:hypothetical protein
MSVQLLWLETLLKLSGGLILLALPGLSARLLGLPHPGTGFWPRLLGGVLVGLAAATYIEGSVAGSKGLALAGAIAINLIGAGVIIALLVLDRGTVAARGKAVLWALVVVLIGLSLFEIAQA